MFTFSRLGDQTKIQPALLYNTQISTRDLGVSAPWGHVRLGGVGVTSLGASQAMENCIELSRTKHSSLPSFSPYLALTSHKRTTLPRRYDPLVCTTHSLFILEMYLLRNSCLEASGWEEWTSWCEILIFPSVTDNSTHGMKSRMLSWWGVSKRNCCACGTVLQKAVLTALWACSPYIWKSVIIESLSKAHNCYQE